jgi:regulator of sigma E protease
MLLTILIFIIILGLLVFVHEAGHFFVAKWSGMKVHEFGFGFPPRLFGIQKIAGKWKTVGARGGSDDSTIYSINSIPLGGFVKIMGENNEQEANPQSFINKPFLPRLLTLVAGVLMNVILAWALISIGYSVGLPVAVDDPGSLGNHAQLIDRHVAILDVREDSPAEKAGLQPSDIILTIDNQDIADVSSVQKYIQQNQGKTIDIGFQRVNEMKHASVVIEPNPDPKKVVIGIGLATYGKLRFPWYQAVVEGARTTGYQLKAIITGLYNVFSTGQGIKSLGGPVKIAQLTGQVVDLGFIPLIQFAAFLSLNLAILNILPFPALDGGRVLFLVIEKIRGKRNNQRIEQYANMIGFFLLLTLMLVITVRDVSQLETVRHLFS